MKHRRVNWLVSLPLENRLEKVIPKKTPTLNTVLRNLATLGGFLGRKSDGDPSARSIWIGFQRIQDCVFGAQMARKLEELD